MNDTPTDRELRLLGDLQGKRVLDLGCGTGSGGDHVRAAGRDRDRARQLRRAPRRARGRAEQAEVKVEWRKGDLADLAFLRAESIDPAFSAYAVAEVDDAARLFRQVQRVLKPNGPFVFSYEHPMALCVGPDGAVERSYFDPGPIDVERRRRGGARATPAAWARCSPSSAAPGSGSTPSSSRAPTRPARGCRRPSCGAPARKAPDPVRPVCG